ncbi:MAG: extracellular solute-binding protein [Deltaproteobacteria bacterium]|nr:extracellular solute-binding protein [Deltaproteobacteria bacterium]
MAIAHGHRTGRIEKSEVMRKSSDGSGRSVGSLILIVAMFASSVVFAAAAPANFDAEWAKLVAAAQQEGTVTVASGGAPSRQYRPVVEAFTKKFGVKVEVSTGNATDTVNRVLAERKAGKFTMDVALISSRENQQRLVPSESLVPITPMLFHPEVTDLSKWYKNRHMYADKFSKFTLIYHAGLEDQYETWYNTDKIKEAEIATLNKQTDVFDPKWKGKVAGQGLGDPSGIRQMIDSYFEPDRGPDWVKKYMMDTGVTFTDDRRILETWVVNGRFPLQFVATGTEEYVGLAKKGLPIKPRSLVKKAGVLRASGSGCCISMFANAPHPNTAKLFVNWFLSKEGQTLTHTLIPNLDRSSLRTDVPFGEVSPQQRRGFGKEYAFPDADPATGGKQEEVQKWLFKLWESRQK